MCYDLQEHQNIKVFSLSLYLNQFFRKMKKITLLFIGFCCFAGTIFAQDKTVFGEADIEVVGGFGSPILQFSSIKDKTVAAVGGGGGVVINNFFVGGFGIGTGADNVLINEERYDVDLGYGGLWLGYSFLDDRVAHPYVSLQAAIGGVEVYETSRDFDPLSENTVGVLVPEVGVEINLTQWMRLVGTVGYRWVSPFDSAIDLESNDLSNVNFGITFRFGYWGGYEE